jgi:hypothetical protein
MQSFVRNCDNYDEYEFNVLKRISAQSPIWVVFLALESAKPASQTGAPLAAP